MEFIFFFPTKMQLMTRICIVYIFLFSMSNTFCDLLNYRQMIRNHEGGTILPMLLFTWFISNCHSYRKSTILKTAMNTQKMRKNQSPAPRNEPKCISFSLLIFHLIQVWPHYTTEIASKRK